MIDKSGLLVVVLLSAALAAAALQPQAAAQSAPVARPLAELPVPTITVVGKGSATVAPDLALVNLAVLREAETAREALTANSEAMAAVVAEMKAAGIGQRDLQTSGFSLDPRYVYPRPNGDGESRPPRIVGYAVTNRLTVRVRDLDSLGAIVDKAVSLGVNSEASITFTNDDPRSTIAQARTMAMEDARRRAETLAQAARVRLGPIQEISEVNTAPRPMAADRKVVLSEAAMAVPFESGENTYSVEISAVWRIME